MSTQAGQDNPVVAAVGGVLYTSSANYGTSLTLGGGNTVTAADVEAFCAEMLTFPFISEATPKLDQRGGKLVYTVHVMYSDGGGIEGPDRQRLVSWLNPRFSGIARTPVVRVGRLQDGTFRAAWATLSTTEVDKSLRAQARIAAGEVEGVVGVRDGEFCEVVIAMTTPGREAQAAIVAAAVAAIGLYLENPPRFERIDMGTVSEEDLGMIPMPAD